MVETIQVQFKKEDLPTWAQRHPEVVWLCERDLDFRCDVYSAAGKGAKQHRQFLVRQAKQRAQQARNFSA